MPVLRPCLGCGTLVTAGRCRACARVVERARGTREQRGYGVPHKRARAALGGHLPAPCGYCGRVIVPSSRWVAAHVVDGDPSAGWMVAHPDCNERAKGRTGGGGGCRENAGDARTPATSAFYPYNTGRGS